MDRIEIRWTISSSGELASFIKDILSDGANMWVRDTVDSHLRIKGYEGTKVDARNEIRNWLGVAERIESDRILTEQRSKGEQDG